MKPFIVCVSIVLCIGYYSAKAQNHTTFKLAGEIEFPFSTSVSDIKYGGISGIEYFNDDSILLVSDHNSDSYSYVFRMNASYKLLSAEKFYNLQSVESIRYSHHLGKMFYSYEKKKSTGVGFIENGTAIDLFSEKIPSENTTDNRGIEGITFSSDNSLWVAYEAGGNIACETGTIPFYKFPLLNGKYNTDKKTVYAYPFSRCSCSGNMFNGSLGNGVSEILAFSDDPNKILVLERCFSGISAHLQLYLATVPKEGVLLHKELVFDFNSNVTRGKENKNYMPDNLEAMTWGAMENGRRTLYLASDNNFNIFQRNQVVKLVEIVGD